MQIAVAQLDQVIGDLSGNAAAILEAAGEAKRAGAKLVVTPELSLPGYPPEDLLLRPALRREHVSARARETGLPIVYANRVGGQDELVFDGASFVTDASGAVVQQLPAWHEAVALVTLDGAAPKPVRGSLDARIEAHVYEALVMGVRDYVGKNSFPGVLVGLSGGVDSALVLAVAVDALGRDHVRAVM